MKGLEKEILTKGKNQANAFYFLLTFIKSTIRGNKEKHIPNKNYIDFVDKNDLMSVNISDSIYIPNNSINGEIIFCKVIIDKLYKFY